MVTLSPNDVLTKEVLSWRGLHLLHYRHSSCSQKCRIVIRLKGAPCTFHHVNLARKQNQTPWFMGVNPRGLVPVLVHDGAVIIESNDIIDHIEETFPEPSLIPHGQTEIAAALMAMEDELHFPLRMITMRYIVPTFLMQRSEAALAAYETTGSGQVGEKVDSQKQIELKFWRDLKDNKGVTNAQICDAIDQLSAAFQALERRLHNATFLLGDDISVTDVAWFIYAHRLATAGYPMAGRHRLVWRWYKTLSANPAFAAETRTPLPMRLVTLALHCVQFLKGASLRRVAGL